MNQSEILVEWPDGSFSNANPGEAWLKISQEAGINIPTGCLTGSCGSCEIEVNGEIIRACISNIPSERSSRLKVEIAKDLYW